MTPICYIQIPALIESSGLCLSRLEAGTLWSHNDAGSKATLYKFSTTGAPLGQWTLPITAKDWEDMASIRLRGQSLLLIGDFGDNALNRKDYSIVVINEPISKAISHFKIQFKYPNGVSKNCEALAVMPDGTFVLCTKTYTGTAEVFTLRNSLTDDNIPNINLVAEKIRSIKIPTVTAMDMSLDGSKIIMLANGNKIYEYVRSVGLDWGTALAAPKSILSVTGIKQAEALCYAEDQSSIWLSSETTKLPGELTPLYFLERSRT